VAGRRDGHQAVGATFLHRQILVAHRGLDHPQVDDVVLHHGDDAVGIGDLEADVDVRVLFLEVAEQGGKHVFGDGGAGAEDQHTADLAGEFAHRVFHLIVDVEDLLGEDKYPLARLGEADFVVGAVEQPGIEVFLQLAHLKGHGWLGHMQGLRRLGKAQLTGNAVKNM